MQLKESKLHIAGLNKENPMVIQNEMLVMRKAFPHDMASTC